MSIDNYSLPHANNMNKPKLAMMLPDPSRYSPSNGSSHFLATQHQQQGVSVPPEQKLSLPSIRELLNNNESQPQPQYVSQPQFASYEPQQQTQPQSQTRIHTQPQNQPQPQHHQIQPISQQFIPPVSYQNIYPPQHAPQAYHQLQAGRASPSILVVPRMPSTEYLQPQQQPQQHIDQFAVQHTQRLPVHQVNRPLPPRSVSASSTSSLQSVTSSVSTPPSPVSLEENKDKRKKRQNLPRQTTLILLNWLSEHLDRPYPNSREKYELLMKTRLTIQQLDNWFINARRRKISILKKLKENEQPLALTF